MDILTELFPTERQLLLNRFNSILETTLKLNRKVVSFQANKDEPIYRWFKYKEGFSSKLVQYFLTEYCNNKGKLLDPFAGIGTSLFAGQELGWETYGIELLPVGVFVIETREALNKINVNRLISKVTTLWDDISLINDPKNFINHISITREAFPEETEVLLNKYLTYCSNINDKNIGSILKFAAFSVLEEISFTRKDGQYLRWDYRAKRELNGKPFDKGKITTFKEAIDLKLSQIIIDLSPNTTINLFEHNNDSKLSKEQISTIQGSCLIELPKYENEFFDFIITSPPYCNRYDYTRTYALELVFLGQNNDQIKDLRQSMLSCTVENKEKIEFLRELYINLNRLNIFEFVISVYNNSTAMNEVNAILSELNKLDKLNNNNIPRMVKNYFLEMCFVIYELSRITKSGGYCVMVNDNVRYGGEEIPVDLILSEFAENFGFNINKIFVLPTGKGNSSQQMGNFGRTEVRKCVYLWQKK